MDTYNVLTLMISFGMLIAFDPLTAKLKLGYWLADFLHPNDYK